MRRGRRRRLFCPVGHMLPKGRPGGRGVHPAATSMDSGMERHQRTARERAKAWSIRSELGSTRGSAFTIPSFNEYPSLLPHTLTAVSTDFQTPRSARLGEERALVRTGPGQPKALGARERAAAGAGPAHGPPGTRCLLGSNGARRPGPHRLQPD